MADWHSIFITPQMYADILTGHSIFSSKYRYTPARNGRYNWKNKPAQTVDVPIKVDLEGIDYALVSQDGELHISCIVWPSQGVNIHAGNIVSLGGNILKLGEKAPTTVIGNPPCCHKARVIEEGGYACVCLVRCWCPDHGGPECVGTHD